MVFVYPKVVKYLNDANQTNFSTKKYYICSTMKKLVRTTLAENKIPPHELSKTTDRNSTNKLFAKKLIEECIEFLASDCTDPSEAGDIFQVSMDWFRYNNIDPMIIAHSQSRKFDERGGFGEYILNNLNPNNESNEIYFESLGCLDKKLS